MLSDPEGSFEVRADDWSLVERYRFGTRTCDFLICRRCGVFVAAVAEMSEGVRAVVNVNCLDDRGRFTSIPTMQEFQGETIDARLSRRAANWMPAVLRDARMATGDSIPASRSVLDQVIHNGSWSVLVSL
jgi:hypothetical protein